MEDGGHIYIFASKGGEPTNPDWYHNIVAHPDVTVEVGNQKFNAKAVVIAGRERDEIFAKAVQRDPGLDEAAKKTTRVFPVIELVRQ